MKSVNLSVVGCMFMMVCLAMAGLEIEEWDQSNFQSIIRSNKYVLVEFYSPTCQYCKIFQSEYQIAAKQLSLIAAPIVIGKVNEPKNSQLAASHNVQGLPTIILYDSAYAIPYPGHRQGRALTQWVASYFSMKIKQVQQVSDVQDERNCFIIQSTNAQALAIINKAAFFVPGYKLYHIRSQTQTKITFRTSDNISHKYPHNSLTSKDFLKLKKWMEQITSISIKPLLEDKVIEEIMLSQNKPALIIVFNKDANQKQNQQPSGEQYNLILRYCQEHKTKINCGQILSYYPIYDGAYDFFRQEKTDKVILGVIKQHMRIAYVFDGNYEELTQQSLEKFISDAINDRMTRTVDDTLPKSIQYSSVPILNNETFVEYVNSHDFCLIQFYEPNDEASKYFSSRYESLVSILASQKQTQSIGVAAVDCSVSADQCQQRIIQYYPTIRLYINGLSVQYPQGQKLPQIPQLQKFIRDRIARTPKQLSSDKQLPSEAAVVIWGPQLLPQMITFTKIFVKLPVYFIQTQEKRFTLELRIDGDILAYDGKFQIRKVQKWINAQIGPLLSDLMQQNPDDQIISAIQQRKPIIFLLDVDKQNSAKIRASFGTICKKIGICGAYAESTHPGFSSLLEWVNLKKIDHSLIIYSETVSDKKYIYPYSALEITQSSIEQFINDIKEGKLLETGSTQINSELEVEQTKQAQNDEL